MEISNYIILTDQQLVTLAHDGDAAVSCTHLTLPTTNEV